MNHHNRFTSELDQLSCRADMVVKNILQKKIGFSYQQVIGELLCAASTCRIDILYASIKLSQYKNRPAKVHYIAVKHILNV